MVRTRLALFFGFCVPALTQSVVSTHSGIVYFFDGSVRIGDQQLEQKFGRFPDIGDGRELRTEHGRAEVLLTPGAVLRVGENSAVRVLSSTFSDTRVELLDGSAILEANEPAKNNSVRVVRKNWEVKLPHEGVYRIDSEPSRVTVYQGEADVSTGEDSETVAVRAGETLPLEAVLVPESAPATGSDEFKNWAMSRSQAIASDNATAQGIVDDPSQFDTSLPSLGGFSYFPLTGIPGLTVTNPYGASFWSPFQSSLSSMYFPPYSYGLFYSGGWPSAARSRLWSPTGILNRSLGVGVGSGLRPGGISLPGTRYSPPVLNTPRPVTAPPHVGIHPGVHR